MMMATAEYAISQNSLSISSDPVSSLTVTATQDFIDTIGDLLLDAGYTEAEVANFGLSNYLNQIITITNFYYKSITEDPFDYEVSYESNGDTVAIYWLSDFQKLKYVLWDDNGNDTVFYEEDGYVQLENSLFYDADKDQSTFVIYQKGVASYDGNDDYVSMDPNAGSYVHFRMSASDSGLYVGEYDLSNNADNPSASLYIYADDSGAMATDTQSTPVTVAFKTDGTTMSDSSSYSTKLDSAATTLASVTSLKAVHAPN